ncbi:MAG: glycosyltransferase [Pedobacter sp.]|uniref:glycosyltransferase n=1 Tax=Pedobacter sp. TaxID=1411316 RepID=UPI003390D379
MKIIRFLDWPPKRYYGESHLFHRWKRQLAQRGYKVELCYDHLQPKLQNSECLIIHSRYFKEWQHLPTRNPQNEDALLGWLQQCKKGVGQLIWFDAADSSGSADLGLLPYIDLFLKKQLLRDRSYYTGNHPNTNLRVWLPALPDGPALEGRPEFVTCASTDLPRIRLGWNVGLNDYRYYGYKMTKLSNFLGYKLHPLDFTDTSKPRPLDLAFRGTLHGDVNNQQQVSAQRNKIITLLQRLERNVSAGPLRGRPAYLKELKTTKIGISPFGWGEICSRDFENFIAGCLLVKPSMEHLETFPNFFVKDHTYIPVRWDLADLEERLNHILDHYSEYQAIAITGQQHFAQLSSDHEGFINHLEQAIKPL